MRIEEIRLTDGPNYWSVKRHRLVIMLLDLEEMEDRPSDTIPGFYKRITEMLPTMYTHRCSEGIQGGFFSRVQQGTWMGHIIEHIALEIQSLAGMDTGFGRTREAGRKGLYHVVFSCQDGEAGRFAAHAAVRIAEALVHDLPYDIGKDIQSLKTIWNKNKLGPSTAAIAKEAIRRGIPVLRLNDHSLLQLGYGAKQRKIEASVASTTSNIAVELASDKDGTKRMLAGAGVPVPEGMTIRKKEELCQAIRQLGFPLVIKPVDGNHGRGITTDIRDEATAAHAFEQAQATSETTICEKYIVGQDFRVLVVNYRFVAAALRTPASVTGNGESTIQSLIDEVNQEPGRGKCHENILTQIDIDSSTLDLLRSHGYSLATVLPAGQVLCLKRTANLSTGGTAADVTDHIHPSNIALCERIARIIGLDICGIDIMAPDISQPLAINGGAVLEVNAGPGLRMHLQPSSGQPRNVAAPIIDMLFPNNDTGRIPIIAITGTNGKTTTTRLIAHIAKQAGHRVGVTTTDGVYIDDQLIMSGDCTGSFSARVVLKDPAVDFAVLECARGGLLRNGLGFDHCDVAVITNVGADHLGMQGIVTLEQLARLKGVLAETVRPDGFAVLNADDDRVFAMREHLSCQIALFSLDADSPRIREHARQGGRAAVLENGFISLIKDGMLVRLGPAADIPLTFDAQAAFNIANVLGAALAAHVQGLDSNVIWQALTAFQPTSGSIPGRMNIFDFGHFKIIADYAHNTHGLAAIADFLRTMPAEHRVGVIAGVGDRRDEDIISLGAEAARIFDEIIIRQDKDLRGRPADELNGLVRKGIRTVDPLKKITIIPDESRALEALLRGGRRGMVATFFADDIQSVLTRLQEAHTAHLHSIHTRDKYNLVLNNK